MKPPAPSEDHTPAMSRAVRAARLEFVASGQPIALAVSVALGAITIAVLAEAAPLYRLFAWFATLALLSAGRWILYRRYRRAQHGVRFDLPMWERRFYAGCLAAGSVWGSSCLLFFPDDVAHQVFLAFVLAGVSSGALTEVAVAPAMARAFVIPCVLPLALRLFAVGGELHTAMGTMAVLYGALVTLTARRGHGQLVQAIAAQRLEHMKNEFVSVVSHELRTPLTSIRGSLGLVANEAAGPISQKARDLLQAASRQAEHLAHLIDDLLDIRHIESAATPPEEPGPATTARWRKPAPAPAPAAGAGVGRPRNPLQALGWPAKVLLIAAAYFITGKLGLLLAIPPGYATAIWPPSGIALGALLVLGRRCWPGVWLGSFLTNVATSFDGSSTATILKSLGLATAIGGGACLHAALGATLIRRFVGSHASLAREREILGFFALGGPVAALASASVGVASLYFAGAIPAAAVAYSWWTWWVGDTIGSWIFAPLVLMWAGGREWASRRIAVTLPLAVSFAVAVLVFLFVNRQEWQGLERRLYEDATDLATAIERRLDFGIEALRSVGGLFAASERVEAVEFNQFATAMLAGRSDLQAIEWIPRVAAARRARFEGPGIFERGPAGLIAARTRAEYYPVHYVEPYARNASAVGFDMGSERVRRQAMERARDTGQIVATPPIELIQASGTHDGLLIFLPIYSSGLPSQPTVADRRRHLQGFAAVAIRAHNLVRLAVSDRLAAHRLQLRVEDAAVARGAAPLYRSATSQANRDGAAWAERLGLRHRSTLGVAGRTWELWFSPTLEYLAKRNTLVVWLVLAGGLLFAALVGIGALVLTGRTVAVEALVRERTAELAATNERLAKADRVKSEFISTVSHELRTPLTSIRGSLGLIAGGAAGSLPEKAAQVLDLAYRNTERLTLLINDILDIEKLESGRMQIELAPHSLGRLVAQAVEANSGYGQSRNVRLVLSQPAPEAPVEVDSHRFLQIMANLLSNAAKYSPVGGAVEVTVGLAGARVRVSVTNYGPPIPEEFRGRMFQRFSQADSSDSRTRGGTGLGLAISKALIERMRGTIGYESGEGGTTFFIDLPSMPV